MKKQLFVIIALAMSGVALQASDGKGITFTNNMKDDSLVIRWVYHGRDFIGRDKRTEILPGKTFPLDIDIIDQDTIRLFHKGINDRERPIAMLEDGAHYVVNKYGELHKK